MKTNGRGEFFRLLLPGSYSIKASQGNKFGFLESDLIIVEVGDNIKSLHVV